MKAYYDKWYHPRNATLVVVGDFNTDETLARVEALFAGIPAGPNAQPLRLVEPPQRGEKRIVIKKETPIERLFIGFHAPPVAHSDAYVLQVVETILSTGKSSRLYQRLVERDQSVTAASANFHDHIDPSLFYFKAELKPGFALPDVERAIDDELNRLKNEPVTAAELGKARRQIEADLVMSHEEPLQQAMLLGQYETIAVNEQVPAEARGYRYLDTLIARMQAVTAEDIQRVAAQYFTADNRTVGYLVDPEKEQASAATR